MDSSNQLLVGVHMQKQKKRSLFSTKPLSIKTVTFSKVNAKLRRAVPSDSPSFLKKSLSVRPEKVQLMRDESG